MPDFAVRRDRLLHSLREEGLETVLVTNPVNVTYLTGFTGESSYLVLMPERSVLVSDGRFTTQLAEEGPELETYIRPPVQTLSEATGLVLDKLGVRSVGYESAHLTVAEHEALQKAVPGVCWKPGRDRVEKLRQIKDADELLQIREAIHIAERAWAMFRALLRRDDNEKELSDAMEMYVRRAGGKCTSFPTIVAVDERAALPHAPPTDRRVRQANLILVDWGASGRLYKSDLTRVLIPHNNAAFQGDTSGPNSKLADVYGIVLRAQQRALEMLRPGVKAGAVDAAARGVIAEAGYGDFFTHSLGHGLGLQVHEAPLLKPGSEAIIEPGMVVTIEPGVYLPGWGGIRIEDDVLVTTEGCEVLTHVARDLSSNLIEL